MDHDHDYETPTGPIKLDNQAQEFTKRLLWRYGGCVETIKNIKRVNEILDNELNERTNFDKKNLPQFHLTPNFNELLNSLIPKIMGEFVKSLNRSNIYFVLNFEPIMTGTTQKTWNLITVFFLFENCRSNANLIQNERKQRFKISFGWKTFALFKCQFRWPK